MRCRRTRWTGWLPPPPRSPPGRRSSGTRSCPGPRPALPGGAPSGGAELLVRLPGGGYVPVIVVRHRVTDPGGGALTAPLPETDPRRAAPRPAP